MKKYILFILVILSISKLSAQEVSTEDVNRLIDKLNCEAVQLSLTENGSKFLNNCNCDNNPTYTIIRESIPMDQSATIALCDEIQILKSNGNKIMSGRPSIIEYLSDVVFSEKTKYSKIFKFSEGRKSKPEFSIWKESLKTKLRNLLDNAPQIDTMPKPSESTNEISELHKVEDLQNNGYEKEHDNYSKKEENLFTFNLNVIGLLFTTLVGIILFFLLKQKKADVISDNPKRQNKIRQLEDRLDRIENLNSNNIKIKPNLENRNLMDEIIILKKELDFIKSKVFSESSSPTIIATPNIDAINKSQNIEEKKSSIEVIYLPYPDTDGSFNDNSSSKTYTKGTHIFRLTKINSLRANFQIEDDESAIKMALTYYDKFIIPVCESENQFQDNYKRISTLKQGEVSLENGKWIIKSKARIKYES